MHRILTYIVIGLASIALTACGNDRASKGANTLNKDDYVIIEYFGLAAKKPKDWTILDQSQNEQLFAVGRSAIEANDKDLSAAIKASEKQALQLFTFFKYEQGAPVDFNPNLIALAENLKFSPGVKSGKDYFFHFKKLADQTGFNYEYAPEYVTTKIGGQDFTRLDAQLTIQGNNVKQSYYAAKYEGFILLFISSYQKAESKEELDKIVSDIKLDW